MIKIPRKRVNAKNDKAIMARQEDLEESKENPKSSSYQGNEVQESVQIISHIKIITNSFSLNL